MPEGHTVHRLARVFTGHFQGFAVDASSPQGRFAEGAALLDGRVLLSAEAAGKQMFLGFSDEVWLRVHLGLYGMWRFFGTGLAGYGRRRNAADPDGAFPPEPRGAVRLRLIAGRQVADLSGPTACMLEDPAGKALAIARLGQDPLRADADPAAAYAKIAASRQSLALLLMRQDIIAGIGNIFRAELLFRARLNPHAPGRSLAPDVWDALWADLTGLLEEGVGTGRIVTTRPGDRAKPRGKATREDANYVAHRTGRPCRVCGTPIEAESLGGRTLYWCPVCQAG